MLRISLSGPPNRRKQPERYVQCALKFFSKCCGKTLTKNNIGHIVYIKFLTAGKTAKEFQMKKENFLILGMLALGLVFAGCASNSPSPSENKTTAEWGWWTWVDDGSQVTIQRTVDSNGVCAITTGGTAETDMWKAAGGVDYTGEAGASYTYVFEAWTSNGERKIRVQYGTDPSWFGRRFNITTTRTTYTIVGSSLPKGGEYGLSFQCANQLGTIFVKMVSISLNPVQDGPSKTIKITGYNSQGITNVWGIYIFSELTGFKAWPPIASAEPVIDGQTITYTLVNYEDDWNDPKSLTGTEKFFIRFDCTPALHDSSKDTALYVYSVDGTNPTPVDIKDELTTFEWSKFIWIEDYAGEK
jgi:hypothetical protein